MADPEKAVGPIAPPTRSTDLSILKAHPDDPYTELTDDTPVRQTCHSFTRLRRARWTHRGSEEKTPACPGVP
jgi:hypothetical protein